MKIVVMISMLISAAFAQLPCHYPAMYALKDFSKVLESCGEAANNKAISNLDIAVTDILSVNYSQNLIEGLKDFNIFLYRDLTYDINTCVKKEFNLTHFKATFLDAIVNCSI